MNVLVKTLKPNILLGYNNNYKINDFKNKTKEVFLKTTLSSSTTSIIVISIFVFFMIILVTLRHRH